MKNTVLYGLVIVTIVCCTGESFGDSLSGHPTSWIPNGMLGSLDPNTLANLGPTVEASLAEFPGCGETLLSALISPGYLETLWTRNDLEWAPLDIGFQTHAYGYNDRAWGSIYSAGDSEPMILSGQSYTPIIILSHSPLILDLNRDGVPGVLGGAVEPHSGLTVSKDKLVLFDIDGDGFADITEWIDNEDGLFVAVDVSTDGNVVEGPDGLSWEGSLSGRNLLGTSEGHTNGFEKLALRDTDSNSVVSGQELDGLYLWVDVDSNGLIDSGELSTMSQLDLSSINLPGPGQTVGSAVMAGQTLTIWDWWPSYAQARKNLSGPGFPPMTVAALEEAPIALQIYIPDIVIPVESGWVSKAALEAIGMDFQSVTVGCLWPDGSKFVLEDRNSSAGDIAAGLARRLWVFEKSGDNLSVACIKIPFANIRQLIADTQDSLIVIGNGGSEIIRLNLSAGNYNILMKPISETPGFRATETAARYNGDIYMTGYLYNGNQEAQNESIIKLNKSAIGSYSFEAVADMEAIRSLIGTQGTVAQEYIVSDTLGYFVVKTASGSWNLLVYNQGVLSTIDSDVSLKGFAASGSKVLYFKTQSCSDEVEVKVKNIISGETIVLGTEAYCYPYLKNDGSLAVVTKINWSAGTMTLYSAKVYSEAVLEPVLTTNGIGALRISDDGRRLGYLGPDGLKFGCTATLAADLCPDCKIDLEDFAQFAEYWLQAGMALPADLYKDGNNIVDSFDLNVFINQWLQ